MSDRVLVRDDYLAKAIIQARRYVEGFPGDIVEGTPEDDHLRAAVLAVAQYELDGVFDDFQWTLSNDRTLAYKVFERTLRRAMGERE